MKKHLFLACLCSISLTAFAADPSESGVPASPLKNYSCGIGAGVLRSVNPELKDVADNFLKLTLTNSFQITDNMSVFLDADWLISGNNYGADLGFDVSFNQSSVKPFIGFGAGGHTIERTGTFGDDFAPSITAHIGCMIELTETVALRIRAPYHMMLNENNDHCAGIDAAFVFYSKLKNVKKLNYN